MNIKTLTNFNSIAALRNKISKTNTFLKKDPEMVKYFDRLDAAAKSAISKCSGTVKSTSSTIISSADKKLKETILSEKSKRQYALRKKNFLDDLKIGVSSVIPTKESRKMKNSIKNMQKAADSIVSANKEKYGQEIAKSKEKAEQIAEKIPQNKPKENLIKRCSSFIKKAKEEYSEKRKKKFEEKLLKSLGKVEYTGIKVIRHFPL